MYHLVLAVDWRRRAKEHWTLQTESFKIESRVHFEDKFKQFLTRSELQIVPSFVQTQVTQGDMFSDRPNSINFLLIIHFVPRSLQWFRSRLGKLSQGIRGFLFWDKNIFVTFRTFRTFFTSTTHQILIKELINFSSYQICSNCIKYVLIVSNSTSHNKWYLQERIRKIHSNALNGRNRIGILTN